MVKSKRRYLYFFRTNYNKYIGFGSILDISRIIMFIIGIIVFALLVIKFNNYRKNAVL